MPTTEADAKQRSHSITRSQNEKNAKVLGNVSAVIDLRRDESNF